MAFFDLISVPHTALTLAAEHNKVTAKSPLALAVLLLFGAAILAWRGGRFRRSSRGGLGSGSALPWRQRLPDLRPAGLRPAAFIPLALLIVVVVVLLVGGG